MKWSLPHRSFLVLMVLAFSLSACLPMIGLPENSSAEEASVIPSTAPSTAETFVDSLLVRMTLEEKIGQMTLVLNSSVKKGDIKKYFIGSVFSGGGGYPTPNTAASWAAMTDSFQNEALTTRLGIPIIYGVDANHGHASLYGATVFPQQIGLGATRDADLVEKIAVATSEELRAVGISWNFSPVVAVPQDIRWGRTYESYGEDPALVSELADAFIKGSHQLPADETPIAYQVINVLATPKHFLGDGGTTFGSSTQNIVQPFLLDQGDTRMDDTTMRKLFLPPYQTAVESGARSVMVSFSSWNGLKMHAQKYWITDVLKGELGFTGFVVSDYGGVDQLDKDYYKAVVTSVNAGVDMVMMPTEYVYFIDIMKKAVKNGDITVERIDDAARRILLVKYELGLFERPFSDPGQISTVGSQAHRDLARQAVQESLVLLKNENTALPIASDATSIFVAGAGADNMGMQCGGWTIEWQGKMGDVQPGTSILEGIREAAPSGTKIDYNLTGNFDGTAEIGIAVVGEQPYAEGVGDRADLSLSETDIQTITHLRAHSNKLIVILLSGRPMIITPQYQLADAWVAAWLPGSEGAGVADVLFGQAPFTGKLPYTWPRSNDQLPINITSMNQANGCDTPLFPYGYGQGEAGSAPIEWLECQN